MGMAQSRANSAHTNGSYHLRAAVKVQEIPEQRREHDERAAAGLWAAKPNFEVVGECGHRLTVISSGQPSIAERERSKIEAGKPKRRRCESCPKEA